MFRLPNLETLDKKRIFSVQDKQKGKHAKQQFLVCKRLIQFLNKATYNSFLDDNGTRNSTPNHFLLGNMQDNINTFYGN